MERGALSRFRVIDLSQARAGPICVMQLADFGADVLKVEAPAHTPRQELYIGDRDGADMQNLHRNKRSITLDLKSAGARVILERLVRTADVVVENFRPDVKTRLGLDYDTLRAIDTRIVLVSISGFGQDGPYRRRPGFDQILQGMCGLMSTTGEPDGTPMRAGAAVIDVSSGLYAAIGALTALLEREVSGEGQWVRTSLLHAGIGLMDFQAARWLVDGTVAGRTGNDHPTSMPTSAYPTEDGWINVGAGSEAMWVRLCEALGQPSLAGAPEFHDNAARIVHRDRLNVVLGTLLRTRTTAAWVEAFAAADVPCGPIYTMDQVFADPQVEHCGIATRVDHPRRGPLRVIAPVVSLARTPGQVATTMEDRGGSTEAVLDELGFGVDEVQRFRAERVI